MDRPAAVSLGASPNVTFVASGWLSNLASLSHNFEPPCQKLRNPSSKSLWTRSYSSIFKAAAKSVAFCEVMTFSSTSSSTMP